jgi:hypothetical protein
MINKLMTIEIDKIWSFTFYSFNFTLCNTLWLLGRDEINNFPKPLKLKV